MKEVKKMRLNIVVFLCMIVFMSCKEKTNENQKIFPESTKNNQDIKQSFDRFESRGNDFFYKDFKLIFNESSGDFTIFKKEKKLGEINLSKMKYEGPGYSVYFTTQKNKENIIIEASADIGTAWYYSVIVENNSLVNQFLIPEPRSDSEKYSLEEFMTVTVSDNSITYGFKKDLVAKYSKVNQDIKSDQNYFYVTHPIKKSLETGRNMGDQFISEMSGDYQVVAEKTADLNSDGVEDIILVLKTKKEFSSDDDSSKKSQIIAFLSDKGTYKKYVNNTIFPNNSNDQFDKLDFKSPNSFTVKLFNEIPNQYFIEKELTFRCEKENLVLDDYLIVKGENSKKMKLLKTKNIPFEKVNLDQEAFK